MSNPKHNAQYRAAWRHKLAWEWLMENRPDVALRLSKEALAKYPRPETIKVKRLLPHETLEKR